jgi:DNA-binding response OmpR family regulator
VNKVSRVERDAARVLFVEDDRSVAQMYKLKLELDGYQVDVASDGEMAVELARRRPFGPTRRQRTSAS